MSAPARTPGKPGPAPRFTREEVFATALRLIDREEPDAFTMRRLADEMGIGVMTLYGYVANKNELLEGVTALALQEVHQEDGSGGTWDEQVAVAVRELYLVCLRHPHLMVLVTNQSAPSPGVFRTRELILRVMCEAGFEDERAVHALGVLTSYVLGFAVARAAARESGLGRSLRELPAEDFPYLRSAGRRHSDYVSDEAFEYGLGLLLDGLRRER